MRCGSDWIRSICMIKTSELMSTARENCLEGVVLKHGQELSGIAKSDTLCVKIVLSIQSMEASFQAGSQGHQGLLLADSCCCPRARPTPRHD